jgi:GNAT superfamily N-acetyltransferase
MMTPPSSRCLGVVVFVIRQGIGRALIQYIEEWLQSRDFRLLHVKTRGPSRPDPSYSQTRRFYQSMGFLPLFETTLFWGTQDPTLLLVKPLG